MVERDRLDDDADATLELGAARRTRGAAPARRRGGWARRAPARGCRAAPRASCRCGSARRSPSGSRGRGSAPPSGCGTGRRRRTRATPPRRAAGPRRCGGRRGTGSRGSAAARPAPAPSAVPRMVCSSSSVSMTRRPPNRLRRPRVTPYTPALDADVLAEDDRVRPLLQQLGEGRVDRLRERQRGPPARTVVGRRGGAGRVSRTVDRARRTSPREASRRSPMTDFASSITSGAGALVAVEDVVGRAGPGLDEVRRGREQRVALVVAGDLGAGAVAELDVGAGVAQEAHGPQVQQDRAAPVPDVVDRGADVGEQPVGSRRRGLDVLRSPAAAAATASQPAGRGAGADAEAVVLDDDQQRAGRGRGG